MRGIVIGLAAAALLAACGKGNEAAAPTPTPAASVAAVAAAAPAAPVEPDVLSVGKSWKFNAGSKGAAALTKGWATPEPWGVWSMAKAATIVLPIDPSLDGKSLDLAFVTQGFVGDKVPMQTVNISTEGSALETWTFKAPLTLGLPQKLTVPASARKPGAPLTLEFALPNAASPKAIGESGDERQLALGVSSVSVTAAN